MTSTRAVPGPWTEAKICRRLDLPRAPNCGVFVRIGAEDTAVRNSSHAHVRQLALGRGLPGPDRLKMKGIAYEETFIDLDAGDQHKPEFRQINPQGAVRRCTTATVRR